jgi:glutathione synthase
MRVFFLVNSIADLKPSMTTTRLIAAAVQRGLATYAVALDGVQMGASGAVELWAQAATLENAQELRWGQARCSPLLAADRVLVRLNPSRFGLASQHSFALSALERASAQGTEITNAPSALRVAGTKAFLSQLPEHLRVPQSVVGNVEAGVLACEHWGPDVVLKPVAGTRGRGVIAAQGPAWRWRALLELLLESGPVVVQPWWEAAAEGDTRVVLIDGEPLRVGGQAVAVRRRPALGEFRSNLHAGGSAERCELTAPVAALCRELGPLLRQAGLRSVGADVAGDRVLELNVWAPGGLVPFERVTGLDATGPLLEALLTAPRV